MSDFLAEKTGQINARMDELRPMVDEYERLQEARKVLVGIGETGDSQVRTPNGRRRPGRRRPAAARTPGPGVATRGGPAASPKGRRKGTGSRQTQVLELVARYPGITIPQLAEKMGIKHNYLYQVLPGLAREGKVRKEGRGWHPVDGAS